MSHTLKMILGCIVPFILIFLLPLFGVSDGVVFLIFIGLMMGCHLFMMGGHGHGHGGGDDESHGSHDDEK